jgi:transcriptional regulator with XRE-family HTH domain
MALDFVRIGDKLINPSKINRAVERILELRVQGLSQQEAADTLGVDRTLISRLEALGEVGKGSRIGLIAFPIGNRDEVLDLAKTEGVEYTLVMTNDERWSYFGDRNGVAVINEIMNLIYGLLDFDAVIFVGSDMRIRIAEAILGPRVVGVEIGASPIEADVQVDLAALRDLIQSLHRNQRPSKKAKERFYEKGR